MNPADSPRPTTLILLPGLDGSEVHLRPLVRELPEWITPRVVTFPPTGPNDYRALLPIVQSACDGLDDFVVLGWSFSGPLALMYAATHPSRLRCVVLCATFVRPPWPFLRWLRFAAVAPIAPCLHLGSRLLTLGGGPESEDLRRDRRDAFRGVSSAALCDRMGSAMTVDVRESLRQCEVPVLYVRSTRDAVVPSWNTKEIRRTAKSLTVVDLAGSHLALRSNAKVGADLIARFVAERRHVIPSGSS